ncbi:ubiquinone biosynthesis hydrox [Linderina pennispora]|uniref:Ubiquinone biosynthesis hydrox n=1 Tax=Linderina pennispora TaxID=61395 RepID=A0A1Y1VYC1_9FUNG|nr:ubiquinone biosynthesis hydrox [Linderina pennispora]ORX66269.1 ubiquinone biosynthesis hydrox [Linderina pennispora]
MAGLNATRFAFAARALKRAQTRFSTRRLATAATATESAAAAQPVERYDIVIVGGGPHAAGSRPADTFLNRTLQITASNKLYLEKVGSWSMCNTERVQPYDRVVALDGSGSGRIELNTPSGDVTAAYMIETKNLVSGMLKFIDAQGANIDVVEKAKVANIAHEAGSVDWPVVTLGNKRRLQARLLVGTDGGNSSVRKFADIGTYGTDYEQYGLIATLCLEQLNRTAYQRFLPEGPVAVLPFPNGFANLVWSLPADLMRALKTMPEDAFALLMQYLYGLVGSGASEREIMDETKWRLDVFAKSNASEENWLPPNVAAISPKSRMSFPLRLRSVDRLVGSRGLNMGIEDVQSLVQILEQAALAGEDIGTVGVLERYNRQRYVRNLAMQGVVDKVWHTFSATAGPIVKARSMLMNGLDRFPAAKDILVKNMMM